MGTSSEAPATRPKRVRMDNVSDEAPKAAQAVPLAEIFKQHLSQIEGHVRMLDLMKRHAQAGSDNAVIIESLVNRASEMLNDFNKARTQFESVNESPAKHTAADAAVEPASTPGEAQGGKRKRKRKSKTPRDDQKPEEPTVSNPDAADAVPSGNTESTKVETGNKRSSDEHLAIEATTDAKSKKAKTKKSVDTEIPVVEFEDISAEVDARLKQMETKHKTTATDEKKRKRESEGKPAAEVQAETGSADAEASEEKPKKKRAKKQDVSDEAKPNGDADKEKAKDGAEEKLKPNGDAEKAKAKDATEDKVKPNHDADKKKAKDSAEEKARPDSDADSSKVKDTVKGRETGKKATREDKEDDGDGKPKKKRKERATEVEKEAKDKSKSKGKRERGIEVESEHDGGIGGKKVVAEATEGANGEDGGAKKKRKRTKAAQDGE